MHSKRAKDAMRAPQPKAVRKELCPALISRADDGRFCSPLLPDERFASVTELLVSLSRSGRA